MGAFLGLTLGLCLVGWKLDDHRIPWLALPVLLAACLAAGASWLAFARGFPRRPVPVSLDGTSASQLVRAPERRVGG